MASDGPSDPGDFEARLRAARRGAGLDPPETPEGGAGSGHDRDMGLGVRIAVELVAGVLFGLLLGLGLDRWLGIAPWGLIVGVLVGSVAGFMNVYRAASGAGYAAGFKPSRDDRGRDE